MNIEQRYQFILAHSVCIPTGCRIYQGISGAGTVQARAYLKVGKYMFPHYRIIWEALFGVPVLGKFILHKCGNPDCNNPDHLYLGTQVQNAQDAQRHGSMPRNRTGIMGVSYQIKRKRFMVIDYTANKTLYHGKDFFEACCRRKSWENAREEKPA